jgi:hypothetical protein
MWKMQKEKTYIKKELLIFIIHLFCFFIYGLFSDAENSVSLASNGRLCGEYWLKGMWTDMVVV